MEPATAIPVISACYALGCVSTSYYAVKWMTGRDLRQSGTGTLGSTNAGRILGRAAHIILGLLDVLKGWAALALAAWFGLSNWWLAGAGLAVVAGHLWPAQLGFHGGKGLATSYGVFIWYSPPTALLMLPVLGAGRLATHSTTLGAVLAFLSAPLLGLALGLNYIACVLFFILASAVTMMHRRNIREALQRRRNRAHPAPESPAA